MVPTVKHGGGNVKCWGCTSSSGVGNLVFIDGKITGEVYRDILQRNLFEFVKERDGIGSCNMTMTRNTEPI